MRALFLKVEKRYEKTRRIYVTTQYLDFENAEIPEIYRESRQS